MSTSTIIVIGVLVLVGGYFLWKNSSNQEPQIADPDGQVLDQLKKAGSNLSKPHEVEFFLYLPTLENAERVKQELVIKGFSAEVNRSAQGSEWLCQARKKLVRTHPTMVSLRNELTEIANRYGGEYDGWGTPVVE